MIVYIAGNPQYESIWVFVAKEHGSKLLSFHYTEYENKKFWKKTIAAMLKSNNKVKLFLDSGAYSALTQGVTIDIYEYIEFVKRNEDHLEIYANLDVIGDAEGTWKNQMIMEKAGLHPMPVYHHGEDISYLERYLAKGYDYLALGGLVGSSSSNLINWLDPLFKTYLCDKNGFPKLKLHGFGLTSLRLMLRYPWYSVDSTSWVVTGRMGSILIPRFKNGQWIYDEQSLKISVSNKSPNMKDSNQHFTTMPITMQKIILEYIHDKGYVYGKSDYKMVSQDYELQEDEKWASKKPTDKKAEREVEIILEPGISNIYQLRDEMNIIYFKDLEKSMPKYPWAFKKGQNGLFY